MCSFIITDIIIFIIDVILLFLMERRVQKIFLNLKDARIGYHLSYTYLVHVFLHESCIFTTNLQVEDHLMKVQDCGPPVIGM